METRHRKKRLITDSGIMSDPSSELQPSVKQPSDAPFPLGSQNQNNSTHNDIASIRGNNNMEDVCQWLQNKVYHSQNDC